MRWLSPTGYILVQRDGKFVPEHRVIMEEKLGRPLLSSEVVHHRNRDRLDNSLSNLRVFPSTAAHLAHHRRRRSLALFERYARFIANATGCSFAEAVDGPATARFNEECGILLREDAA